ncbi:MAG: DNA mismatch repair endonuclease MutL [Bacilli bacterium]
MKIRVMSENLANKIAAGEVVEKCASVVKELVENSIDAKATHIKINLEDGGLKKIEVIDDGIGMDKDDAQLAFARHATSKIYKDDDLYFIETLGFRGEALASIASVAEVNLVTCNAEVGTHVHIKGGSIDLVEDIGTNIGTTITITNLFYNTPARLKYLKSEATEANNCIRYIEKLALSKENIAFTLTNNDRVIVKTSGSGKLLKCIHEIYGLSVSSNMLEISASSDDFEIYGYISKPSILKKNRNHLNTIVNGRVVRNNDINKAINDAYNTYKHEGFYPIVVINIVTDPTLIDVNIHPTKQDIKISMIENLEKLLYNTIKKVLYTNILVPNALVEDEFSNQEKNLPYEEEKKETIIQTRFDFTDINNSSNEILKNEEIKKLDLYPIGQIHGTYIIAEDDEAMYIIDQHAAHERINYEMITKKYRESEVEITELLVPLQVELPTSEYNIFLENKEILTKLGFVIEEFGINTIIIKAHPTWINKGFKNADLKSIIDLVITNGKKFSKEKFLDSLAKMVSCKMSIKANEKLSFEEMDALLKDLVKCDNPYNCCHGRPSIMKFTNYELEKMFKRVI